MGSFFGHALPGTFFFMFGVWQLLNAFYYYLKFNNTQTNHLKRTMTAYSFRCCCSAKHKPFEGILKLTCCSIGMAVEGLGFFWGIPAMYQHFTMYAFFGFAGLVDILLFYDCSVPKNFDFCLHAFGFFIEGLLFAFHLHGRSKLDIVLHTLLVYSCYFCAAIPIFMMIFSKQLIFRVLFGIGMMVQGSWFWQVGSILYPIIHTKWCETCPHEVMNATMIFCWHLFLNSVFSMILYAIMYKLVKPAEKKSTSRYEQLETDPDFDIEDQNSELISKDRSNESHL